MIDRQVTRICDGVSFCHGAKMAAVDRAMFDVCGLDVLQVMETAGRMVAVMARQMLGGDVVEKRIVAVCGSGGNGGDGLVAARHLHGWGGRRDHPDVAIPRRRQSGRPPAADRPEAGFADHGRRRARSPPGLMAI